MTGDSTVTGGETATFVAFAGTRRVAAGTLAEAAAGARRALESDEAVGVLVFDTLTGDVVDLDLRGTQAEVLARYTRSEPVAARRGRPKLGVVAREVTLLPRHWEWLASQPGGASVALRKLVEAARKLGAEAGSTWARVEAAYRFMSAMAGDLPGFEDAARALFASDLNDLRRRIVDWPPDIRGQLLRHLLIDAGEAGDQASARPHS
jgi:uncharacterized protein